MSGCCELVCILLGTLMPVCQETVASGPQPHTRFDPACIAAEDRQAQLAATFHARPLQYPPRAARERVAGFVKLRQEVSTGGRVSAVQVLEASPPGYFEESAIGAALRLTYEPHLVGGKPHCVVFTRTVEFKLHNEKP